jgi:4a-hydroxytetrahydrobiopterin dehydratase
VVKVEQRPLSQADVATAFERLAPGWLIEGQTLQRRVEFSSFLTAVEFIDRMAPEAERLGHHPDLRLSWRFVELSLTTHSADALTALDFQLAAVLDRIIRDLTS